MVTVILRLYRDPGEEVLCIKILENTAIIKVVIYGSPPPKKVAFNK